MEAETGERGMATVYRRGRIWHYRFRYRGQEYRGTTEETNERRAKDRLREAIERARAGPAGEAHEWREVALRYSEEVASSLRPSTVARYHASLKALHPHVGDLMLDEIDRQAIADFVSARKGQGVTDATIRRDLTCLSAHLSAAVNWGWLAVNPVRQYATRALREAPPRVRYLRDRAELERLLAALQGGDRAIVEVAVETGMRRGELLALEWPDIDFTRREIAVRDSKTRTPRRVPMSSRCEAVLRAQSGHSGRVFNVGTGTALAHRFKSACRRAGIEDFHIHDLRHTFASWAVQRGVDLYRLGRVLGHSTQAMTARYAHLRPQDLRGVVEC